MESIIEDELYYGSVSVNFTITEGQTYKFNSNTFQEMSTEQYDISRSRMHPLSGLGPDKMVIPAVPSADLVNTVCHFPIHFRCTFNNLQNSDQNIDSLPNELQSPLLKSVTGNLKGKQSGRRSALLKLNEK